MSAQAPSGGDARFSLARWSERKRAAARGEHVDDATADAAAPAFPAAAPPPASVPPASGRAPGGAVDAPSGPLPAVESLTFESDFTAFMQGGVDADVKRAALRKLLRDPRFNVMDGLDVYIDDYSQPDPIPPAMLARLAHSVATLNPQGPGLDTRAPAAGAAGDVESTDAVAPAPAADADAKAPATHADAPASETRPPAPGDGERR